MASPCSTIGITLSPVVRDCQPNACSSCSPRVATSSPVFSKISSSSVKARKAPYLESKSSPRGSWEGKSVRRTSSFARIFLISFGEAFSGGGYGVFDVVEDFSLDKGDKGTGSLRE